MIKWGWGGDGSELCVNTWTRMDGQRGVREPGRSWRSSFPMDKVIESRGSVGDELGLGQVSGSQIREGFVSSIK